MLGQKVTFRRRKVTADCKNVDDFEKAVKIEICTCEEDDYEW